MISYRIVFSSSILVACLCVGRAPATTADYTVAFNARWSQQSHPNAYPANAHFSRLIGGVHNDQVNFWMPGGIATYGMEIMAELGGFSPLRDEVQDAIGAGTASAVILGGGIASPGSTSTTFQVSTEFPLATLVTMIAPSPDWFVGVHDLDLRDGAGWKNQVTVDLFGYDAGTDHGANFTSPDIDAVPKQPIALLGAPFAPSDPPLGTYTFTRIFLGREFGDYNSNGIVDAADYIVWRDSHGQSGINLPADGDLDGTIDADDFGIWKVHFGQNLGSATNATAISSTTVPEPSPGAIVAGITVLLLGRRRLVRDLFSLV